MTDRLIDLIVGLQRLAEGTRMRTEDLEYTQREERYELIKYVDQLLTMTEKLRASLLEDRKRLMPVERERIADKMPRVVTQGPIQQKVESNAKEAQ